MYSNNPASAVPPGSSVSRDIVCLPEPLFDDLYLSAAKYPLLPPISDAEVAFCQTCMAPFMLILLLPNEINLSVGAN